MRTLGLWSVTCCLSLAVAVGAQAFPPGGSPSGMPGVAAAQPAAKPVGPVAKLKGGQTVEELFKDQKKLSGKEVAVRGQVVKVSLGIMGKNWLHLQDGSGSAGTNDLTVTTSAEAAVGDVVVARGKLSTAKDFGHGYKYEVILDDAKVSKE